MKNGQNLFVEISRVTQSRWMPNTRKVSDTNWLSDSKLLDSSVWKRHQRTKQTAPYFWFHWGEDDKRKDKRPKGKALLHHAHTIHTTVMSKEHSKISEMLGGRQLKIHRVLDWNMRDGGGDMWSFLSTKTWHNMEFYRSSTYIRVWERILTGSVLHHRWEKQQHKIHVVH